MRNSLEKLEEDQEIISYPKPPVLDMNWDKRDTNVVEQANIPKLSELDDIGAPLRLFQLFFDDALVDTIVGYSKFNGH